MKILFAFLSLFPLAVSAADYDTVYHRTLFDDQLINFDPATYAKGCERVGDGYVVGNGRLWFKKVRLPLNRRDARATLRIRLTSNGDPWDKAGSCFVLPAASRITMLGVAKDEQRYPAVDSLRYERFVGIVPGEGYLPAVELLRFMTPFGVGAFTPRDSVTKEQRQPAYIDGFAPFVEWEQDITDRLSLLQDSVYIGIGIDSWTKEGYKATVELVMEESRVKGDKARHTRVLPLVNTIQYVGQPFCDLFHRRPLEVPFDLPAGAHNVRLHYVTTGHGGHSGGDEFTPCENILSVDGREVKRFTPWRTDCASFRRFNPSTGVWLVKREVRYITEEGKRGLKTVEEPIGSSDLSRSNWCPGSDVPPVVVGLGALSAGRHTLSIAIPSAQAFSQPEMNHWLVSAWITYETGGN